MLDRIILYSIKNKLVVGFFTLALIVWGSYSIAHLPIDATDLLSVQEIFYPLKVCHHPHGLLRGEL